MSLVSSLVGSLLFEQCLRVSLFGRHAFSYRDMYGLHSLGESHLVVAYQLTQYVGVLNRDAPIRENRVPTPEQVHPAPPAIESLAREGSIRSTSIPTRGQPPVRR